jgi:hypothetical protein
LDRLPHPFGGARHLDVVDAEVPDRVDHRVDHGRGGRDRAGLAHPLDAEVVGTPRLGPVGVEVGEVGTIASTPAVVNAVVDALRPLGVSDVRMPTSPRNVWEAIQAARASDGGAA